MCVFFYTHTYIIYTSTHASTHAPTRAHTHQSSLTIAPRPCCILLLLGCGLLDARDGPCDDVETTPLRQSRRRHRSLTVYNIRFICTMILCPRFSFKHTNTVHNLTASSAHYSVYSKSRLLESKMKITKQIL